MVAYHTNAVSELLLQEDSVFELWDGVCAEKTILLGNSKPLKYAALVHASTLAFQVNTIEAGSELEMMLLCPVLDNRETSVNLMLNLRHNDCKIHLHLVALVFSDAKTTLNATIFMEPHIQGSASKLLEETVVLSPEVQLQSLPILDIQAKNIQAAHGAKIYRLDQDTLFYLQSKGLSYQQAQYLLLASYGERLFEWIALTEEEKWRLVSDFLTFDL